MRLLVVNDEEGIREVLKGMLSGNEVVEAEDGDEGWRMYQERGLFDLVVTDVMHPGLDGIALTQRIRQTAPKQAVLVMTAAYGSGVGEALWNDLRVPVMTVPFQRWQLEQSVFLARTLVREGPGGRE